MVQYLGTERYPYRNAFDFVSMQDYQEYVRCNELRTLRGEAVKSFEEIAIANFLAAHGISYGYERPYVVDTTGPDYRRYKPDFFLSDHDIYIEHFALNEDGQPPEYMDPPTYLAGIEWKRKLHETNETTLLETYSYLKRQGRLESSLARALENAGVELARRSDDELPDELRESTVFADFAMLLAEFLNLFRQSDLALSELRSTALGSLDRDRMAILLDLFEPVLEAYEAYLTENGEIDFADMIRRATGHVESRRFLSPFTHILVDEFQDISRPRANLILALLRQRPDATLFAVGDDWQAIYRFTGSDIGYVRDFQQVFGATATVALGTTFRFNDQIGQAAAQFVLKNPAQIAKTIESVSHVEEPAVSLVAVESEASGLMLALEAISNLSDLPFDRQTTVLVLARYKFVFDGYAKRPSHKQIERDFPSLDVRFSTVHAAKGKEADFVVVLGLVEGRYGFPCEKPPDEMLEALLPPREAFVHAEERRLFYVALTRARHRVYLVFNPLMASTFVAEMLNQDGQYAVCTDEFDRGAGVLEVVRIPCPACSTGVLVAREGRYGPFVGCSHFPYCRHKERPCGQCGSVMRREGRFRFCTNPNCDAVEPVCPECGASMVERVGPYGEFWGCSNYRRNSDFLCTHTEKRSVVDLSSPRPRARQPMR